MIWRCSDFHAFGVLTESLCSPEELEANLGFEAQVSSESQLGMYLSRKRSVLPRDHAPSLRITSV
jgi:hypothetical protein